MRGGFLNLSLDARRIDLVRAVVEGIAHNLALAAPSSRRSPAGPASEIVFGGGAARSALWARSLADVLDRPVATLADPDHAVARAAGARRAAARSACSRPATSPTMVDVGATLRARRRRTATSTPTVQTQFEAAFEALRPICQALNP